MVVRIQSEAGVRAYGQLIFGYTSATEDLVVDYVRVRKPDGEVAETPPANAQDFAPEVFQSAPMYSDYRERHVTVSRLRPGDTLEYHTTTKSKEPLAHGEFWFVHRFPSQYAVTLGQVEVDVPKDRALIIKSPKYKYTTADKGDRRTYTWVRENFVPDRKRRDSVDDEEDADQTDASDIQLTSFKDWQQVAHWYARLQGERVLADADVRRKAEELTKGATTPTDKVRRLYDFVARDFRYVSLSFGVGRFQPHSAADIFKGGYGDCKDKHTLLQTMLRVVGVQSYPVLINSSAKLDPDVPSPAQFDHVITLVELGDKPLWLDTTPEVAPFGLIMYQLRNKQALVASEDAHAGLQRTTSQTPVKNMNSYSMDGKVSETGTLDATVELTVRGDSEILLRTEFRHLSQAEWKRLMNSMFNTELEDREVSDIKTSSVDDTSQPFHLSYRMHLENYFRVPSTSYDYYPYVAMRLPRLHKPEKPSEPMEVGPAVEITQHTRLEFPPNFTLRLPGQVSLVRDFGSYTSSMKVSNRVFEADRKLTLTVDELPSSRRSDIESLRSIAQSATEVVFLAIAPASASALAATGTAGDRPGELRRAGLRALNQRDYATASQLLKRAVEKEPDSNTSWDDLGRAYSGLNDHDQAIAAYKKQLEVNPSHKLAYSHLASELQEAGKNDEAVAAWRKQLDNIPLDKTAHKKLGLLLQQLNHNQEAVTELEAAAAIPPEDPEVSMALAQLYSATGNAEKGHALMTSVVGGASTASADMYAAALADDVNPQETLQGAQKVLDDIGDQFDSNVYANDVAGALSAMRLVGLSWARVGWAKAKQGNTLEGLRYLKAAWLLTQSGTVAGRMAKLYGKAGQSDNARHYLALAALAGGADAAAARSELEKLDAAGAPRQLAEAQKELDGLRSVPVRSLPANTPSADFQLVFDGSDKPERIEHPGGIQSVQAAVDALQKMSFPVLFPDYSSVKVVRAGQLVCNASGCNLVLKPVDSLSSPR